MPSPSVQNLDQREVQVPFRVGADGGIAYVTTESERASQHIRSIVQTMFGERVMRPDYGSNVRRWLFDVADEAVLNEAADELKAIINRLEPGITIREITAKPNDFDPEYVTVLIRYTVPITKDTFVVEFDTQEAVAV